MRPINKMSKLGRKRSFEVFESSEKKHTKWQKNCSDKTRANMNKQKNYIKRKFFFFHLPVFLPASVQFVESSIPKYTRRTTTREYTARGNKMINFYLSWRRKEDSCTLFGGSDSSFFLISLESFRLIYIVVLLNSKNLT